MKSVFTIFPTSKVNNKTQCKWSIIEKEAFRSHFSLQQLDYNLHNARFVIKTAHKPSTYILESAFQNKETSLSALGMSGYNCTVEYIAGTGNTCADLLSRKPDNGKTEQEKEPFVLDINDKTFKIGVINSNEIDPKQFASCRVPENNSYEEPDIELMGLDMVL